MVLDWFWFRYSPTFGVTQGVSLHGTAALYADPPGTTPGLIGSPMAVPLVVSGLDLKDLSLRL